MTIERKIMKIGVRMAGKNKNRCTGFWGPISFWDPLGKHDRPTRPGGLAPWVPLPPISLGFLVCCYNLVHYYDTALGYTSLKSLRILGSMSDLGGGSGYVAAWPCGEATTITE